MKRNTSSHDTHRFRLIIWRLLAFSVIVLAVARDAWSDDSHDMIALQSLSRAYGFRSLAIHGNTAVLSTRFHSLELEKDSRQAVFDGISIWLNGPVEKSWSRWLILREDVEKAVIPLLNPAGVLGEEGFGVVVLDAGHGGEDRGASMPHHGVDEKQLTLELAKNVWNILARYRVKVHLTRADDKQVPLEDRSRLAEIWKADVFVSVHFNATANSKASGIETYILAPAGYPVTADPSARNHDQAVYPGNRHDGANLVLGYTIQKSLLKYTHGEDRGVRRARFAVIRNSPCPAALVECGFLSNWNDRQKIITKSYRDDITRGIAEGIMSYLNTVKRAHNLNP